MPRALFLILLHYFQTVPCCRHFDPYQHRYKVSVKNNICIEPSSNIFFLLCRNSYIFTLACICTMYTYTRKICLKPWWNQIKHTHRQVEGHSKGSQRENCKAWWWGGDAKFIGAEPIYRGSARIPAPPANPSDRIIHHKPFRHPKSSDTISSFNSAGFGIEITKNVSHFLWVRIYV